MTIWWNPIQPPYYPPYQPQPVTTGWSCPRCGRVWAPHVSSCTCRTGTITYNTWGTGTTDSTLITNFNIHIPDDSPTFTFPDAPDPDEHGDDDDGPEGCPV